MTQSAQLLLSDWRTMSLQMPDEYDNNEVELYLDSNSSGELADTELETNQRRYSRHFTLSPETTDYDSNCGDLDSLSNDMNGCGGFLNSSSGYGGGNIIGGLSNSGQIIPDFARLYTSMPVLEDGLSSGHASDTENNNPLPAPNAVSGIVPPAVGNGKYINVNSGSMVVHAGPIASSNSLGSNLMSAIQAGSTDLMDISGIDQTAEQHASNPLSRPIEPLMPDTFDIGLLGLQQQPQQQPSQVLQPMEETRVDSKSYLDSDITSIFSNSKSMHAFDELN